MSPDCINANTCKDHEYRLDPSGIQSNTLIQKPAVADAACTQGSRIHVFMVLSGVLHTRGQQGAESCMGGHRAESGDEQC